MGASRKSDERFSASKRDFLKKMALMGVYIGPVIKTFEMAELGSKPTGPPPDDDGKKKKTTGTARLGRFPRPERLA